MPRFLSLLAAGCLGGAGIAWLVVDTGADRRVAAQIIAGEDASAERPAGVRDAGSTGLPPAAGVRMPERIQLLERAAGAASAQELELMIDSALNEPASPGRDFEIATLLSRRSEFDARSTVEFAHSRSLGSRFLQPLYRIWALDDPDAAIRAVGGIANAATRRELAISLLSVVGFDADGIARIAAGLPEVERVIFELDALKAQAEKDSIATMRAVLDLPTTPMQQATLADIASVAARQDPLSALALADSIADAVVRRATLDRVLSHWARNDPQAVFALIESRDFRYFDVVGGALDSLSAADADRLLLLAETFPEAARREALRALLMHMATIDPLDAILRADELVSAGGTRDSIIASLAQTFGRANPQAAVAWARDLVPPSQAAYMAVLRGVMEIDGDLGVEYMLAEVERPLASNGALAATMALSEILRTAPLGESQYALLADRLSASGQSDAARDLLLNSVMLRWSAKDAESASNWVRAHAGSVSGSVVRSVASQAAGESFDQAAAVLSGLPAHLRPHWIAGVAAGLAEHDLARAVEFLDLHRNQSVYDQSLTGIVNAAGSYDPERVARLFESAGDSQVVADAAGTLALQWALHDPEDAASWAATLANRRAQEPAVEAIARSWASIDAGRARNWLLDMPPGTSRDAAIDGYLLAVAVDSIDEELLRAYSSDSARERSAADTITRIGRDDVEGARRLIDFYISDAAIRQQIEASLARSGGAGI